MSTKKKKKNTCNCSPMKKKKEIYITFVIDIKIYLFKKIDFTTFVLYFDIIHAPFIRFQIVVLSWNEFPTKNPHVMKTFFSFFFLLF